mmetsp:Transcript_17766/g.29698  ORF Transcript_17766/g.29698 Transcript_17766/m.29698 type:complete len:330 (-) Transcript_17766:32-1021(-)
MEQKVTDFFPFHTDVNTAGKFLYLSDQQSMSGQFIFNLMLEKYIKERRAVHIVSVAHKRHHYDSILRKLSIDLVKLEADGLIHIHYIKMPIISRPHKTYDENIDPGSLFISANIDGHSSDTAIPSDLSPQSQAKTIVNTITDASLDGHPNRVVMIDDLIALEVILGGGSPCRCQAGPSLSFLSDFQLLLSLNKIHSLVVYSDDPVSSAHSFGSVAVEGFHGLTDHDSGGAGSSSSSGCSDTNSSTSLPEVCKYRADISVVTSKLDSGYSADVHGQILVTTRNGSLRADGETVSGASSGSSGTGSGVGLCPQQLRLLYKTSDAGIKCALH